MCFLAVPLLAAAALARGDGAWSSAAPLPWATQELAAAAFHGEIYVAGGIDGTERATAAAFRYDPSVDRWDRIADLPAPRHHMPLVVVGDSLYAVGGLSQLSFRPESTLWLYRDDKNRWEARAPLPAARGASGAGSVAGRLIVVGGWGAGRHLLDSSAVYDPRANRWRNAAPIPTPRDHLAAAVVGTRLYAIGGRPLSLDRNYDVVEAYDLATDHWTRQAPMPSHRGGLAAAVLGGEIHTFGGEARAAVFGNHEVYDAASDRWRMAPPLPTARHGLGAATLADRIYVVGGGPRAGFAQTAVVEVYAPSGR